jgi:hypothetical protein
LPRHVVCPPQPSTSKGMYLICLGHLFCDFCIRSALKVGHPGRGRGGGQTTYAGSCPICRRKFTTKNLIALEIKVRTLG